MKVSSIIATMLAAAGFAAARTQAEEAACAIVPKAVNIAGKFVNVALGNGEGVKKATQVGGTAFQSLLDCPNPPEMPKLGEPGDKDCGGFVKVALDGGVGLLKNTIGLIAPPKFDEGLDGGLKGFRTTLGCRKQDIEVKNSRWVDIE